MNSEWKAALAKAVRDVFETLCFMLPAPGNSSAPPEVGSSARVIVAVDFSGDGQGVLHLTLPESMVATVASNMLGDDTSLDVPQQHAAVCELANIVCGNVLPLIGGERAVFDIAPPRVIATVDADVGDHVDATARVLLEDGLVTCSIALRMAKAGAA